MPQHTPCHFLREWWWGGCRAHEGRGGHACGEEGEHLVVRVEEGGAGGLGGAREGLGELGASDGLAHRLLLVPVLGVLVERLRLGMRTIWGQGFCRGSSSYTLVGTRRD